MHHPGELELGVLHTLVVVLVGLQIFQHEAKCGSRYWGCPLCQHLGFVDVEIPLQYTICKFITQLYCNMHQD